MHRLIYLALICTLAAASCDNATAPTDASTAPQSGRDWTIHGKRSLHSTPLSLEVSRDGDKDKVRVVGLARDGYVSGVSFYPPPSRLMPPFPSVNRSSVRVRCNKGVVWINGRPRKQSAQRTADGFGVRVKVQLDGHQKDVPALSLADGTVRVCKQGSY